MNVSIVKMKFVCTIMVIILADMWMFTKSCNYADSGTVALKNVQKDGVADIYACLYCAGSNYLCSCDSRIYYGSISCDHRLDFSCFVSIQPCGRDKCEYITGPYGLWGDCGRKCNNGEVFQDGVGCVKKCNIVEGYGMLINESLCVKFCPRNTFRDPSDTRICRLCHLECGDKGCYGPKNSECIHCKNVNFRGRCVKKCPSGYLNNEGNCILASKCSTFAHMDTCLRHCPTSTYPDTTVKKCFACDNQCNECTGYGNQECKTCKTLRVKETGACVDTCPDRYPVQDANFCFVSCPKYVYNGSCSDDCPANMVKYDHQCIESCPGDAPVKDPVSKQCKNNCDYVWHNNTCVKSCPAGWMKFDRKCLISCPSNTFISGTACVNQCPHGTAHVKGHINCIAQCPANINYMFQGLCVQSCPDNFKYIRTNICYEKCPNGTVYIEDKDTVCMDTCCPSKGVCSLYRNDFANSCVKQCPSTLYNDNVTNLAEPRCREKCLEFPTSLGYVDNNLKTCVKKCPPKHNYVYQNDCYKSCPADTSDTQWRPFADQYICNDLSEDLNSPRNTLITSGCLLLLFIVSPVLFSIYLRNKLKDVPHNNTLFEDNAGTVANLELQANSNTQGIDSQEICTVSVEAQLLGE